MPPQSASVERYRQRTTVVEHATKVIVARACARVGSQSYKSNTLFAVDGGQRLHPPRKVGGGEFKSGRRDR